MEHTPQGRIFFHDSQRVAMGIAVVDDHRQVQFQRQFQLGAEHLLLKLPRRVFCPVVVQPDLADGHHLGPAGQLAQFVHVLRYEVTAVLRMDAHGGVHMGMPGRQRNSRPGGVQRAAGVDDQTVKGGKHGVTVGVKGLVIIVGMGVKQHHAAPPFP